MQMQVNLLPIQYRPKPAVRLWPILITVVLMLNLLFISTYWLSLQLELSNARSSLSGLQNEIKNIQNQVNEAEWKSQLAEAVSAKRDYIALEETESILWFPMLEAIERAMVPRVTLSAINTTDSGDIRLVGTTKSEDPLVKPDSITAVANFLGSLQPETGLEFVQLLTVTSEGTFTINMSSWYGREVLEDE